MSRDDRSVSAPAYFVHPNALVESTTIGRGTRIWAFAHILPGAIIGSDCNICDGVFIENDVIVGDRVTVKCGVQLWDTVRLEDDVFIGPNTTFSNDLFPRSRHRPSEFTPTIVRRGASVGANATLLAGVTIGEDAMIGAGAVVTKSVPARAVVIGNPARVVRFVGDGDGSGASEPNVTSEAAHTIARATSVSTATLITIPLTADPRGTLTFAEVGVHLPFVPRRYFSIMGVPSGAGRGEHAHRKCHQFLVALSGGFTLSLDDGSSTDEVRLDSAVVGVHAAPLTWCTLRDFTADAVVLVLASDVYDAGDYIHDYDTFLSLARGVEV